MLTEAQKDTKIAYLIQENNRLREALLDAQITSGQISLTSPQQDQPDQQDQREE